MIIELTQNVNNAWFWLLKGANGECLATSESYSSKGMCKKTAKMVAKALNVEMKEVK